MTRSPPYSVVRPPLAGAPTRSRPVPRRVLIFAAAVSVALIMLVLPFPGIGPGTALGGVGYFYIAFRPLTMSRLRDAKTSIELLCVFLWVSLSE
jgi:hypothetical protein